MHQIQHIYNNKKGSFFIEDNGKKTATLDYMITANKKLVINHTEVDDSLKGQGVGKKLLEKLVEYSRQQNMKVIPHCSFADAVLNRTPEWRDILA